MQNTMITAAGVIFCAFVGFNAGVGVVKTTNAIIAEPRPVAMQLDRLYFENGQFHQKLNVEGGPVRADWSAEIMRGSVQLCSGGGTAPYSGKLTSLAPDAWTGDNCPPLLPGDVATAVWSYRTVDGLYVNISGEITLTPEALRGPPK